MTTASISLRPVVREVMRMAPERSWSETAITTQARQLIPDARGIDVLAAITWNHGQGYLETFYNKEMECDVWKLTKKGKAA